MSSVFNKENGNKSRGEETRQKLLSVAARLFAVNGFKGVSMRSLAKEADINIATVGYHFGGKLGLYEAIIQDMINRKNEVFPDMEDVHERIAMVSAGKISKTELLSWYFEYFINGVIGDPDTEWMTLIVTRELAAPSEMYPVIENELFAPSFDSLSLLLKSVMDDDVSHEERVVVAMALIGMALKFVHPKAFVSRIGWDGYTPENIAKITEILCRRIAGFVGCQKD